MITIGLAEDNAPMREAIIALISKMNGYTLIVRAINGIELIKSIQQCDKIPLVVFLDIQMPVMDGVSTAYYLKTHFPQISIIALSHYSHHLVVQDMFDAGALGFLLKENISEEALSTAITNVLNNIPHIDKNILLSNLVSIPKQVIQDESVFPNINKKELTFLQLTATSISYEQIAQLMNVATDTIYNYQRSLKAKIGCCTRQDLMLYAIQNGIAKVATYKPTKYELF